MMATRFTDAQVASYIQNNALSGAGLQQAAQVFQLPPDQIARAQQLLAASDPSIAAASQAYEAAVAGRPDLVEQNLSFYNAATGTGSGVTSEIIAAREAADLAERTRLAQLAATQQAEAARAAEAARIKALQNNIPKGYDQAYVNRLIGEAAQQAGGTLSYADASRALNQLGIPSNMLNSAMGSGFITEGVTPFANATQGFQQNFNNYTSIPIGGQFNPGAVGGASPYSQIMGQMRPVGNPYAGVIANQPMGGYNPNIYDAEMPRRQNLLDRLMNPSIFDQSGFGDSGPGAGPGASDGPSAAASASDFGGFNGGLITKVMGPNPPTPDDGTMFVQKGEYIVKKDSVNKYGKGLLDKINDGKIPAKKMKSLLG
jgi:hypothetical protein